MHYGWGKNVTSCFWVFGIIIWSISHSWTPKKLHKRCSLNSLHSKTISSLSHSGNFQHFRKKLLKEKQDLDNYTFFKWGAKSKLIIILICFFHTWTLYTFSFKLQYDRFALTVFLPLPIHGNFQHPWKRLLKNKQAIQSIPFLIEGKNQNRLHCLREEWQ